jgi:hypothetical protein
LQRACMATLLCLFLPKLMTRQKPSTTRAIIEDRRVPSIEDCQQFNIETASYIRKGSSSFECSSTRFRDDCRRMSWSQGRLKKSHIRLDRTKFKRLSSQDGTNEIIVNSQLKLNAVTCRVDSAQHRLIEWQNDSLLTLKVFELHVSRDDESLLLRIAYTYIIL